MNLLILWCSIFVAVNAAILPGTFDEDTIIKQVESSNASWKAGSNFGPNTPHSYIKRLMGLKKNGKKLPLKVHFGITVLPDEFDSRKQWPNCPTIGHIRDQGNCGSCWAVATAAAFSDRVCIVSENTFTLPLSDEEVVSCCDECGAGCDGGDDGEAWDYFRTNGLVTGGDYQSNVGCQPYEVQACDHHVNGSLTPCPDLPPSPTPECEKTCTNPSYKTPFSKDHHKASSTYSVDGVYQIKQEIMQHGPVSAGLTVFEDFLTYKSGVYQHVTGEFEGLHAVRIIGWGEENDTPYWLVANSWNTDWGDQGLFKILLGKNECDIESDINAGQPNPQY